MCRLLVVLLFCLGVSTTAEAVNQKTGGLVFAVVDGQELMLDLYRPEVADDKQQTTNVTIDNATKLPLVIWVHGGAWRAGTRHRVPILRLLEHGYCIASVDYRLSGQAKFPAAVHDIKSAIRFLCLHADKYRVDPSRIIIAGESAGGHLAALVGVSQGVSELEGSVGELEPTDGKIVAILSFFGASNLNTILSQSTDHGLRVRVPALRMFLGAVPSELPEVARLASPVHHVDGSDPPLWLIHGTADPQMPPVQSVEFARVYRDMGLKVRLEMIPDAKHGGGVFYTNERLDQIASELRVETQTK